MTISEEQRKEIINSFAKAGFSAEFAAEAIRNFMRSMVTIEIKAVDFPDAQTLCSEQFIDESSSIESVRGVPTPNRPKGWYRSFNSTKAKRFN